MVKRIITYVVALAIVLGTTLQVVPRISAAVPHTVMSMGVGGDPDSSAPPCKGLTPACIDSMGCLMTTALPAMPLSTPVPVQWSKANYASATAALAGVTLEPELSPPILRA